MSEQSKAPKPYRASREFRDKFANHMRERGMVKHYVALPGGKQGFVWGPPNCPTPGDYLRADEES